MNAQPQLKPTRDRQFTGVFALIVTAAACAVLVLATPRAIVPRQLPALVLDPVRVQAAIDADDALIGKVAHGLDIDELHVRYLEIGRAERAGPIGQREANDMQFGLRSLAQAVFARVGEPGRRALRAQALQRFMVALGAVETSDVAADVLSELGSFPDLLQSYGILDARRQLVAPELCLRASFKARWNLMLGLPITQDFATVEVQAFEGWIALHANAAPTERRLQAARAFHLASGHRSALAFATWLFTAGHSNEARVMLQKAYSLRPELFTRNFQLGVATLPY